MDKYFRHKKTVKKHKKAKRFFWSLFVVMLIAGAFYFVKLFKIITSDNVDTQGEKEVSVFIKTGSTFEDVKNELYSKNLIINKEHFEFFAEKRKYVDNIKAGHYILRNGMSNYQLINMLRSGIQTPVKVTFNNIRFVEELAGRVSLMIEPDSAAIMNALKIKDVSPVIFLPDTYEFFWNITAEGFVDRMMKEYEIFWDDEREAQAKRLGFSKEEVSILASIVDKETNLVGEMPDIAGVYVNRLKLGWPLQADPTLIFAIKDFDVKRVLDRHKEVESPYNTYKYAGLPPGPICIPSKAAINAVLNYKKHNYLYFCAASDCSGRHVFAKTLSEHNRNAEKYHKALKTKSKH